MLAPCVFRSDSSARSAQSPQNLDCPKTANFARIPFPQAIRIPLKRSSPAVSTKLALAVAAAFALAAFPSHASGQAQEAATIDTANNVLTEFINMPSEGIPRAM